MRQRKIKEIDKKISAYEDCIVRIPENQKGRWREVFHSDVALQEETSSQVVINIQDSELFAEIGCGKGNFITKQACLNPHKLYIGFEGNETVIFRAMQKTKLLEKENPSAVSRIKFCPSYIYNPIDVFAEGELTGIFLNFSDPWPKPRHEKRRLTQPFYIKGYYHSLQRAGAIEFKTDNDNFFRYSVENLKRETGFEIEAIVEDLHKSEYMERNIETEYEHKFNNLKHKIKFVKAIKK